jgi:hypothetical protein
MEEWSENQSEIHSSLFWSIYESLPTHGQAGSNNARLMRLRLLDIKVFRH